MKRKCSDLIKSNLPFFLMDHTFDVKSKNSSLTFYPEYFLLFCFEKFYGFTFTSIIHFEVVFVLSVRFKSKFFFCLWMFNYFSTICWKAILLPFICFSTFVKVQLVTFVRTYFCVLYSPPLIYVYILSPMTNLDHCSYIIFKSDILTLLILFMFFKILL